MKLLLFEKQKPNRDIIDLSRKWPFVVTAVIGSQILLIEDGCEIHFFIFNVHMIYGKFFVKMLNEIYIFFPLPT
jgi:hypothetical protein